MIEGIPDWVRIAALLLFVVLVPAMALVAQLLKRRAARRRLRGWGRG